MESNQFPKYPQELDDDISALAEYLFEKYNDAFEVFYLEECDSLVVDTSYSNYASIDEYGNEIVPSV
jgi:hypothetical protein